MRRLLFRIAAVLVAVAGLTLLVLKTARDAEAEPYAVRTAHLRGWTVATDAGRVHLGAVLLLRPPSEMPMLLAEQIFHRRMEGLITPTGFGIPLILRHEFDRALAAVASPEDLADLAAATNVAAAPLTPACLGVRSAGGTERGQFFFLLFDAPAITGFRREVAKLLETRSGGTAFDPDALPPVLLVTSSARSLRSWSPTTGRLADDCIAPVVVE